MPPPRRARVASGAVLLGLLLPLLVLVGAAPASAADSRDFSAGALIADSKFFDGDAMTPIQVWNFIDAVNPGCAAGEVCLENYRETTSNKAANPMCDAYVGGSFESAARIIAKVGKACGISQKAILVILQKEQSLVTNSNPSDRSFWYAMGAGCPDSTGCTTPNTGLFEQVYYGSYLLKRYTMPPGTGAGTDYPLDYGSRYPVGKSTNILFNPKTSCGSAPVYVTNQATHALYIYTPYQPNAAALQNLYGTGNSCSAYGNRNFWRMYTDWFGSTGAIGEQAIAVLHGSEGGTTGWLGSPVGDIQRSDAGGGGLWQQFDGGIVTWTEATAAQYIKYPYDAAWLRYDGPDGDLKWPTANTATTTDAGGGLLQSFQGGILAKASGKGTVPVTGGLTVALKAWGGIGGPLGWPTATRYIDETSGAVAQKFQGGIVFHNGSRHGYVATTFVDTYQSYRNVAGYIGWSTGHETASDVGNGGTFQAFSNGMIAKSNEFGLHTTFGWLNSAFTSLGGINSLGWPTTDRYVDPTSGLWAQEFEAGTIFHSGTAYALVGAPLRSTVDALGGLTGKVGWPVTAPATTEDSTWQDFTKMLLATKGDGDVLAVYGGLRVALRDAGGLDGNLGWPTTNRYWDSSTSTVAQEFEDAAVLHNGRQYGIVGIKLLDLARARGVINGRLGWPTTPVYSTSASGGGEVQGFQYGILVWSTDSGAVYIPRQIWSTHKKAGGVRGPLGWPTNSPTWNGKTKTIHQDFAGGSVDWTAAGGGVVTLKAAPEPEATPEPSASPSPLATEPS